LVRENRGKKGKGYSRTEEKRQKKKKRDPGDRPSQKGPKKKGGGPPGPPKLLPRDRGAHTQRRKKINRKFFGPLWRDGFLTSQFLAPKGKNKKKEKVFFFGGVLLGKSGGWVGEKGGKKKNAQPIFWKKGVSPEDFFLKWPRKKGGGEGGPEKKKKYQSSTFVKGGGGGKFWPLMRRGEFRLLLGTPREVPGGRKKRFNPNKRTGCKGKKKQAKKKENQGVPADRSPSAGGGFFWIKKPLPLFLFLFFTPRCRGGKKGLFPTGNVFVFG